MYLRALNPHYYSRRFLLHPPIRRCDEPDGGRAHRTVSQHTVSSIPPSRRRLGSQNTPAACYIQPDVSVRCRA